MSRANGQVRVTGVSFRNVPSFVLLAGVPVRLGSRMLRADVAFGGAFYAIVDSEAAGIPIVAERLDDLRRAGMAIKREIESSLTISSREGCVLLHFAWRAMFAQRSGNRSLTVTLPLAGGI